MRSRAYLCSWVGGKPVPATCKTHLKGLRWLFFLPLSSHSSEMKAGLSMGTLLISAGSLPLCSSSPETLPSGWQWTVLSRQRRGAKREFGLVSNGQLVGDHKQGIQGLKVCVSMIGTRCSLCK